MEIWADGRMSGSGPGCRMCKAPLTDDNWSKTLQSYRRYICTACWRIRQKKYYQKDPNGPEKRLKSYRKRQQSWSVERFALERKKNYIRWIKKRYGISFDEFNNLFLKQSNKCPICDNILKTENIVGRGYNGTHIDHCHKTGKIRGLLCSKCNKMIGLAQESIFILENAILYIKENIEQIIN